MFSFLRSDNRKRLWRRLSESNPYGSIDELHRRARFLNVGVLVLVPASLSLAVLFALFIPDNSLQISRLTPQILVMSGLLMLFVSLLNWAGYPALSIRAALYLSTMMIWVGAMYPHPMPIVLVYFVLPLTLSGFFWSINATGRLFLFQLALVILMVMVASVNSVQMYRVVTFLCVTTLITMTFAYHRNRLEEIRQQEYTAGEVNYRLVFNSSMHAVVIHDGVHTILCNDAAARICGYPNGADMVGLKVLDLVHPDDKDLIKTRSIRHFLSKDNEPERYVLRIMARNGATRWVDCHARLIELTGQKMTLLSAIDITERTLTEQALQYRLEFDKIITSISTDFINLATANIDAGIQNALGRVGKFVGADHCYAFMFDSKRQFAQQTHEWCAEGVESHAEYYGQVSLNEYQWTIRRLTESPYLHIPRVRGMPADAPERKVYLEQGLRSLIEVPMSYQGRMLGLLGLDTIQRETAWSEDTIALLKIMGEIFATAIERKRAEDEIRQRNQVLETLNELATIISGMLDTQELLTRICQLTCRAIDATSVYLLTWEPNQSMTVIAEYISPNASPQENTSDLGISYPRLVDFDVETAQRDPRNYYWILTPDNPATDPIDRQHMLAYGCQTLLRIPLLLNQRQMGMMEIWDSRNKREFTPREIELIQSIVGQVALSLEKAQIYSALQQSESRNKVILESLPDLIFRKGQAVSQFELNDPDAMQKLQSAGLPADGPHQVIHHIQEALGSAEDEVLEIQFSLYEEALSFEARLVNTGGGEVLAFVRDITARKQSEDSQLALKMQKERVKILEEFISDASHDLRTPITNLKSRIYLYKRAKDPDSQSRQMRVIETEVQRLETLIEDLLTMSQLDNNILDATIQAVNVNTLIHELIAINQPLASEKNLTLLFDAEAALPHILGSTTEINRVFANLISNAINYTLQGSINIRTYRSGNNGIFIEVSDEGIGIPADDLPRIFDRFYRADKARTTASGGTGLGLSIAKKVVDLHNGTITVESVPNQGTTFRVWLPATPTFVNL